MRSSPPGATSPAHHAHAVLGVSQEEEHAPIERRFREYRMMTSVSVPAYDRKLSHEYSNEVR